MAKTTVDTNKDKFILPLWIILIFDEISVVFKNTIY